MSLVFLLTFLFSPVLDPHACDPVHLGCPGLDSHLPACSWIAGYGHMMHNGLLCYTLLLICLSIFFVLAGTSILWWLYIDHRLNGNSTTIKQMNEEEVESNKESSQTLLVYAAAATIFTVCLCFDRVDCLFGADVHLSA